MDKSILDQFRMTVLEKHLSIYGVKVEKSNGESVIHHWRSNDPVCLYSASKTVTALAIGMCIEEYQMTLNDKVLDFFPEYKDIASPGSEKITIKNLLQMSSGKLQYAFNTDDYEMMHTDWAELFFKIPVSKEPGTYFYYSNACTYMLGRIVARVMSKNLRDFLMPRLFRPLEIFNPQWSTCPQGHTLSASGLFLSIDDFSKLGMLMLNKGSYNNQQIISENYITQAVQDTIDSKSSDPFNLDNASGYGYQLWRCSLEGSYRMDGKYGQLCVVVPSHEVVVTVTAHEERLKNQILNYLFEDIIKRL